MTAKGSFHFNLNLQLSSPPYFLSYRSFLSLLAGEAPSQSPHTPRKLMQGWHRRKDIEFNSNFLNSNSLIGACREKRLGLCFDLLENLGKFKENKNWPNWALRFRLMFQKSERNFRANFGKILPILGLEKLFGDFANFHPTDKEEQWTKRNYVGFLATTLWD